MPLAQSFRDVFRKAVTHKPAGSPGGHGGEFAPATLDHAALVARGVRPGQARAMLSRGEQIAPAGQGHGTKDASDLWEATTAPARLAELKNAALSGPLHTFHVSAVTNTQPAVGRSAVDAYVKNPSTAHPLIVRHGGVDYIEDGHHRITAHAMQGHTTFQGKLLDLDHVAKATDPGLYVGRLLSYPWELEEWATKQGYTLDDELHITVLYSSVKIPWVNRTDTQTARVIGWRLLGPENAVVLILSCPEIEFRYYAALKSGAQTTYDTYLPHLTLFYLGADADTSEFLLAPDYPTTLTFGPEKSGPLASDTILSKAVRHDPKTGRFMPGHSMHDGLASDIATYNELGRGKEKLAVARRIEERYHAAVAAGHTDHHLLDEARKIAGLDADPRPRFGWVKPTSAGVQGAKIRLKSSIAKAIVHYPAGTPGGKGGQFAPAGVHGGVAVGAGYHPLGVGGGVVHLAGPGHVAGAITKYDTAEVVAMRAAAKTQTQTYLLPGRGALQKQIADTVYGTGAPVKNREVHIVIGNAGSGKSTLADEIAKQRGAMVVDSDIVKEHIPEYNHGKNAGGVHEESLSINAEIMHRAGKAGDNIVIPTTGRSLSFMQGIVGEYQKQGYTIHLHHVDVDTDVAVARTLDRARATGRFVDPNYTANVVGTSPRTTYAALAKDTRIASATQYDNNAPGGHPSRTGGRGNNGLSGAGHGPHHPAHTAAPGAAALAAAGAAGSGKITPSMQAWHNRRAAATAPAVSPPSALLHAAHPHVQRLNAAVITATPVTTPSGSMHIHGTLMAQLSSGTSSIPRAYNSAVGQLQAAFAQHAGNPQQLHQAINAIKGPPAAHTFGKKFDALKQQALTLVAVSAPRPAPPQAPVLPSTLPSNKATWNGNTLLRIQQAGTAPNLTAAQQHQALMAISISQSHHPMVKAFHAAMLAHVAGASAGPIAGQPANPMAAPAAALRPTKAPAAPKFKPTAAQKAAASGLPTAKAFTFTPPGGGFTYTYSSTGNTPRRQMRDLQDMAERGNWQGVHQAVNLGIVRQGGVAHAYALSLMAHQATHNLQQGVPVSLKHLRVANAPLAAPAAAVTASAPVIHAASLPAPPPLNPAFAQHAASFNNRIAQFQAAAMGPNPAQAVSSIVVNTPPMRAYQAALLSHIATAYAPFTAAQTAAAAALSNVPSRRKNKAAATPAAQAIDSYRAALHPSLAASPVHDLIRNGRQADIKNYVHTSQAGDHQLAAIYKAQGFDGLPKVVGADEFKKIVDGGGLEMFRTVRPVPGRTAQQLHDDYMAGDYYAGFGVHGNGTYAAASHKSGNLSWGKRATLAARKDSAHYAMGDQQAVMFRLVLKPDAVIKTKMQIAMSQRSTIAHLNTLQAAAKSAGNRKEVKKIENEIDFHRDLGRHAASIGVDAYSVGRGGKPGVEYMVILNRTATAVRRENEKPHGPPKP